MEQVCQICGIYHGDVPLFRCRNPDCSLYACVDSIIIWAVNGEKTECPSCGEPMLMDRTIELINERRISKAKKETLLYDEKQLAIQREQIAYDYAKDIEKTLSMLQEEMKHYSNENMRLMEEVQSQTTMIEMLQQNRAQLVPEHHSGSASKNREIEHLKEHIRKLNSEMSGVLSSLNLAKEDKKEIEILKRQIINMEEGHEQRMRSSESGIALISLEKKNAFLTMTIARMQENIDEQTQEINKLERIISTNGIEQSGDEADEADNWGDENDFE